MKNNLYFCQKFTAMEITAEQQRRFNAAMTKAIDDKMAICKCVDEGGDYHEVIRKRGIKLVSIQPAE